MSAAAICAPVSNNEMMPASARASARRKSFPWVSWARSCRRWRNWSRRSTYRPRLTSPRVRSRRSGQAVAAGRTSSGRQLHHVRHRPRFGHHRSVRAKGAGCCALPVLTPPPHPRTAPARSPRSPGLRPRPSPCGGCRSWPRRCSSRRGWRPSSIRSRGSRRSWRARRR